MERFNELFDELKREFKTLMNENKSLKEKLQLKSSLSLLPLEELLTDENIIDKNDGEMIETVTHRLLPNGLDQLQKDALILTAIDCSGSMSRYEKYMAESFYTWVESVLNKKYKNVQSRFVQFHTQAEEVEIDDAFKSGKSGGTLVSSGLLEVNKIIEEYILRDDLDIYLLLFSDGDNLTSDNKRIQKLIPALLNKVKLFSYLEINQYKRHSTLKPVMNNVHDYRFINNEVIGKKGMKVAVEDFIHKIDDEILE